MLLTQGRRLFGSELDLYRVGKWPSLVANFGVLVGIVFSGLEIRQAKRTAIATTEISIRSEVKALNELILADDDIARLMVRAKDSDADFSPADTEKLYAPFPALNQFRFARAGELYSDKL